MEDHIKSSRDVLYSALQDSKQIDFEIHKTSATLSRIHQTFNSLETGVRAVRDRDRDHVLWAVLDVYRLVNDLGSLLSSSSSCDEVSLYISRLKRLRQALTLLTSTCRLAIMWLQHSPTAPLHLLHSLEKTEEHCLGDHGIVGVAFNLLQHHFRQHLLNPLPQPAVDSLKAIARACDNDTRCISIYVEVRTATLKESLQALHLDYLDISLSEFESVQDIQAQIDQWGRHLEFVLKHLLQHEYTLCQQVFGHQDCFSKIALHSGIQGFIKFGNTVTKAKKEAIKLFKLLDVFSALHNLRQDFNTFFADCSQIQTQTRELIKKLVNGASEILDDLSAQVQLQRLMDPPPDGSLPRLVTFVTEYSEKLLGDDYRPVMDQVFEIRRCSKGPAVSAEIHSIIKSLEVNVETWAKRYEDSALRCIFMMNTSCYLSRHVKGTRLGDLMGESWLKGHEDRVEYYAHLYLRESWGKMLVTNNDRLKGFTEAFDEEYRKQSGWVLCDNTLRWKTWQLIAGVVVPVYKSLVEDSSNKYVKYSLESLQNMLASMLQPKYGSNIKLMDRIKSVVAGRFSPTTTLAAAS